MHEANSLWLLTFVSCITCMQSLTIQDASPAARQLEMKRSCMFAQSATNSVGPVFHLSTSMMYASLTLCIGRVKNTSNS